MPHWFHLPGMLVLPVFRLESAIYPRTGGFLIDMMHLDSDRMNEMSEMSENDMSTTPGVKKVEMELEPVCTDSHCGPQELRDFKNVTNNLMQDALNVWSELWAEVEGRAASVACDGVDSKSEPLCDCREFLEKMWTLRHYLDFAKRLSKR